MAKIMLRKTDKKCATCRNWNGAIGSTTIQLKLGGNFQVEATEKQTCYVRTGETAANFSCQKYEPRY